MTTEHVSSTARVARLVRATLDQQDTVTLHDLATDAIKAMQLDSQWFAEFQSDLVYQSVYEIAKQVVRQTRDRHLIFGDAVTTQAGVIDAAAKHPTFMRWMAHSGDRHIALAKMTRRDLRESAQEDFARGGNQLSTAVLKLKLAKRLRNDQQTVADKWTEDDIRAADLEAQKEVSQTMLGLGMEPPASGSLAAD